MRTLYVIPKMFTFQEISPISATVPDDYYQRSKEFWDYINEKIAPLKIQKIFYDSLTDEDSDTTSEMIKKDNENCYRIVQRFRESGANLQATEDPIMVQETASWFSMLKDNETLVTTQEMIAKSIDDRNK